MLPLRSSGWLVLGALGALGCRGEPLREPECKALLDRYTELLVRSDRSDASAAELVKLQSAARARAERDPAFSQCSSQVSRSMFECAMHAPNVDRMEQCLL